MWNQWRLRSAWASVQSDQSLLSAWGRVWYSAILKAHDEESDRTGHPPRQIRVFAGRKGDFDCFVVLWLKWKDDKISLKISSRARHGFFYGLKKWRGVMRPSWEIPVPLFPCSKSLCSAVPKNKNLDFPCSMFAKIAFLPLFPSCLDSCSP